MPVFGGLFTQIWLTFDIMNEGYKSFSKKIDIGDELNVLSEKKVDIKAFYYIKPCFLAFKTLIPAFK